MMSNKNVLRVLVLTGLTNLAISQGVLASTIEIPIDTTGLLEPISISYGAHTINSAISPGVDIDGYKFSGSSGDSVRIVVTGHSYSFDPLIELRDSIGSIIRSEYCSVSGYSTCGVYVDQSLPATGNYYLNISDYGNSEAGGYTLHIDRWPPVNNWDGLAYDDPISTVLGHAGDHDFFAFEGSAGTGIRLNVDGRSYSLDPRLQVWDPDGTLIFDDMCNVSGYSTCSFFASLDLTESGIYKMGIFDNGFSETGTYNINLACTYGTCPSDAPNPVPLPAAFWLLTSGLLGLFGYTRYKTS